MEATPASAKAATATATLRSVIAGQVRSFLFCIDGLRFYYVAPAASMAARAEAHGLMAVGALSWR
ncbi:hypothetical protein GCM10022212_30020 [Actimicrobium antarcticum]|uniref:Uncharacterized protein n=1 Tax=Actimicrobium antarcticum TaxID=1051899 RepID=A0ABP7TQM6_9BURK